MPPTVANQATFLFTPETFDALCSDLASFPIADAVAASAAYPLVFSPIVVDSHQGDCAYRAPDWLTAARYNSGATGAMRAHAAALESYASDPDMRFVKLLDGGITDNFGTTGLAVERARAEAPHAPLSAREAVKLSRLLFLVADAGVEQPNDWTTRMQGPGGGQLARAIVQSAMTAASRTGFDAMRLQLDRWQGGSGGLPLFPDPGRGGAAARRGGGLGLPRPEVLRRLWSVSTIWAGRWRTG